MTDAAPTTVEAVMYELREDGLTALKAPNCQRRIGELSKPQLEGEAAHQAARSALLPRHH
jgi:hypothetical protein